MSLKWTSDLGRNALPFSARQFQKLSFSIVSKGPSTMATASTSCQLSMSPMMWEVKNDFSMIASSKFSLHVFSAIVETLLAWSNRQETPGSSCWASDLRLGCALRGFPKVAKKKTLSFWIQRRNWCHGGLIEATKKESIDWKVGAATSHVSKNFIVTGTSLCKKESRQELVKHIVSQGTHFLVLIEKSSERDKYSYTTMYDKIKRKTSISNRHFWERFLFWDDTSVSQ